LSHGNRRADPRIVGLITAAIGASLRGMANKQMRITLALAFVVASLVALGSLAGPVSTASAHTWNHRYSELIVPSPTSDFIECVPTRRIHLAGGQYRFHAFIHHTGHRPINRDTWTTHPRLDGGWYHWRSCIAPVKSNRHIYHLTATIRNEASGVTLYNDSLYYKGRYGSGRYHWGSVLDRGRCRSGGRAGCAVFPTGPGQ
jgi:hypothetical protein